MDIQQKIKIPSRAMAFDIIQHTQKPQQTDIRPENWISALSAGVVDYHFDKDTAELHNQQQTQFSVAIENKVNRAVSAVSSRYERTINQYQQTIKTRNEQNDELKFTNRLLFTVSIVSSLIAIVTTIALIGAVS